MLPYTKKKFHCGDWAIIDDNDECIATLDTEAMADALMTYLVHGYPLEDFEVGVPYGEKEENQETPAK